ncbi:MAG: hypothetical protein Q6M54_02805 [Thermostichus sp. DRC_bins_24]
MKPAFVATLIVHNNGELLPILQRLFPPSQKSYSFLRWHHDVSGINPGIPTDLSCQEGQVFSGQAEIRWKPTRQGLSLLYLGVEVQPEGFRALRGKWVYRDYPADLYGNQQNPETRFPRPLSYPNNLKLGQRHFIDANTASVHFIALIPR